MDGGKLDDLKFTNDIKKSRELQTMIEEVNEKWHRMGLNTNIKNTKSLTNGANQNQVTVLDNTQIEEDQFHVYLKQKFELSSDNSKAELNRRISLAWSAFGRLSVFKSNIPNTVKPSVFDQRPTSIYLWNRN